MITIKKMAGSICALVFLGTGCLPLVERPTQTRMIALNFSLAAGQVKVNLSVNNPEVQEALRLIDAVLVSDDFGPNTNRMGGNAHDLITSYAKYNADGTSRTYGPDLYLENGQLEVVFTELGNRSGHFSTVTQKLFNSLQKELETRFGSQRVRVVKPN